MRLSLPIEPGAQQKAIATSRATPRGEETVMNLIMKFIFEETGATSVEYALLTAFIAVTIAAGVRAFGQKVITLLNVPWP